MSEIDPNGFSVDGLPVHSEEESRRPPMWPSVIEGAEPPPVIGPAFIDGWRADGPGVWSVRHGPGRATVQRVCPEGPAEYVLVTLAPTGTPVRLSAQVLRHLLGGGQ